MTRQNFGQGIVSILRSDDGNIFGESGFGFNSRDNRDLEARLSKSCCNGGAKVARSLNKLVSK
jgi:hypothetical protein